VGTDEVFAEDDLGLEGVESGIDVVVVDGVEVEDLLFGLGVNN
jgi:hypothetical protein